MTEALNTVRAGSWLCGECGHSNPPREGLSGLTCEACGVARQGVLEPPLDLPARPGWTEVPGTWYGLGWVLMALLGTVLLFADGARAAVGIGPTWVLLEVVGAAVAAGSSLLSAVWDRWFNEIELTTPPHARTGEAFTVGLRMVPYVRLDGVAVSLSLLDRYYERSGDSGVGTRTQRLAGHELMGDGTLLGRREARFESTFVAPFPTRRHSDVKAEIAADVLDMIGYLVPAARWNARNLREHGGYVVVANVRVGWVPRRLVKRVFVYYLGDAVHVG